MGKISYQGRVVNTERMPVQFGKFSEGGNPVLKVTLAEKHRGRNDKVAPKYRQGDKPADAYVDTTTSWHRVTVFGDLAEELAQDPEFGNGAIINVVDASYTEEDPWTTRDGVQRAGRPETIGDNSTFEIHSYNDRRFTAYTDDNGNLPAPIWDGVSDIPRLQGGGGGQQRREIAEDEGF